jgi:hypothetical protein
MPGKLVDAPWQGVSTLGRERVLENMRRVAEFGGRAPGDEPADVRAAFMDVLNRSQPYRFNYQLDPERPLLTFGDEPEFEARTLEHLMLLPELPDGWRYSQQEQRELTAGVEQGRALLGEVAPEALETLDLLIGELVFGKTEIRSGGSIGDAIGVIWLGPKDGWSAHRFAEALAHEMVHNVLFVEDMVRTIWACPTPQLEEEDGLIRSALLQRRRSYDKAYHSALVSLVVIQLADALGERAPRFEGLLAPTRVTIDEMLAKRQYLTENGRFVLGEMDELMRSLER